MSGSILFDISLVMIVATLAGIVARLCKQPLIPAYIVAGAILGPLLGFITDQETITILAEIGIAFLLFIVGLELDLKRLREIGSVALFGGTIHILILFVLGFFTGLFLRFGPLPSIYIGIIMAFSSTMVVIKILGDRNELDTLHGRIIIGFLLIQDVFAIIALSLLGGIGSEGSSLLSGTILAIGLIILAVFLGKFIFPSLFSWAAKSQELLFLLSVSTCLAFSLLFMLAGFSIVIGAFVAGVVMGNLHYSAEIISRVKSLKDFFGVIFFVAIGLNLQLINLHTIVVPFFVLLFFTVVVLPIVTITICSFFGYKRRTAFLTGISLAQLSEFSLIIVTQGRLSNHVSPDIFSLTIILTLITIILTSYLLKYEEQIYGRLSKVLRVFEGVSRSSKKLDNLSDSHCHDVVLVGYDRTGYSILRALRRLKRDFVVVDFDPEVVRKLIAEGTPAIYGDVGDIEILEKLHLNRVKLVISTVPHHLSTLLLIRKLKEHNASAQIIVTSRSASEALELYEAGADYVIIPHYLGGDHISLMLEDISDNIDSLVSSKISHIKDLHARRKHHKKHI